MNLSFPQGKRMHTVEEKGRKHVEHEINFKLTGLDGMINLSHPQGKGVILRLREKEENVLNLQFLASLHVESQEWIMFHMLGWLANLICNKLGSHGVAKLKD